MPISLQNHALAPLMANRLFHSDMRVAVHDQVARELSDHALQWRRGMPDATMYKGQTEHLHIYLLKYGAEVDVAPHLFDGFTLVHMSLHSGVEIESDGHRLYVGEGRSAVVSPRRGVRLHWHPGTVQLILRVPHTLIRQVMGMAEDEPVDLEPGMLLPPEHTGLWNLQTEALLGALALPEGSPMRAAWLTHFERSLVMFLVAQSKAMRGHAPRMATMAPIQVPIDTAAPQPARRMDMLMSYIDSHLAAPVSLEDLARACGVSTRTLNQLCTDRMGLPPMVVLRNRRLDAVRSHLLLHPDANIAAAAMDAGFGHVGRFASYYKQRFNELPSQTQAEAVGRPLR